MKNIVSKLVIAFLAVFTLITGSLAQQPLSVPNKDVGMNGTYLFQRLRFNANGAVSPLDFQVGVRGTAVDSIQRIMIIDRETGRIVAATSWLYLSEGEEVTIPTRDSLVGNREYGVYATLNSNEEGGTVSINLNGYGYRSENSIDTNQGSSATHTLSWNYYAGDVYVSTTNDIDLTAKVAVLDRFASFSVNGSMSPKTKRLEFVVNANKGDIRALSGIVLTDAVGKRVAKTIRTVSQDKKKMLVAFEFPSAIDLQGMRTFVIKATAGSALNGARVAFFLDGRDTVIQNREGVRLLINSGTDLMPFQTIQVGKPSVQPDPEPTAYDKDLYVVPANPKG